MASCIHFIRHGLTEGVVNKWYYGWKDLPLIEEGVKAIEELKKQGIYPTAENANFFTSGMKRANQTLDVIFGNKPYKAIENLKEMNFGHWECKTFDELKTLDGFDEWMSDKTGTFAFPGGESAMSFYERTKKGFDELLLHHQAKGQEIESPESVTVCHGGVIAASMCALLDKPQYTFWEWIPAPGRGYTIYFDGTKAIGYEKI